MHPTTPATPATLTGAPPSADLAIARLLAAKLQRDLAEQGSSVFVHAPRPPTDFFAGLGMHAFGEFLQPQPATQDVLVSLARRTGEDVAEIAINIHGWSSRFDVGPAEMLSMAKSLIDAAHDIKSNPAAAPAAQHEGGAA
jgi:hypothetical protein